MDGTLLLVRSGCNKFAAQRTFAASGFEKTSSVLSWQIIFPFDKPFFFPLLSALIRF
jgi:hypothetical protein